MKKILFLSLGLLYVLNVFAQQNSKQFAVKSAKIDYQLSGSNIGTKTVYFDDYGAKYYEEENFVTETNVFGVTDRSQTHKITIINHGKLWTIDKEAGKNYKGSVPSYQETQQIVNQMSDAEWKKFSDDLLKSFGGERIGKGIVLGKSCEKIKVMGSIIWVYNGISLKTEVNVMGIIANEEATSYKENIAIDASKFMPPNGINFIDQDALIADYQSYEQEYEDDAEEDITPLAYSYADFQKGISAFHPEGYSGPMVVNSDGQYMAMFNQNFVNMVSVVASSMENGDMDDKELGKFESISWNGKTLRYGVLNSEEDGMQGKALIIPYKEHQMYIILLSVPGKDKATMLKWADELKF